ncbi:MAG: hypothetical protein SVX43_10540 [Cyanobacteriota bacterium]|nr:hypothetical protein [Cyanobacteriota bacterium]
MMTNEPWYEVVSADTRLTQGDIILNCPVVRWSAEPIRPAIGQEVEIGNQTPSSKAWRRTCEDIKNGYSWNLAMLNEGSTEKLSLSHRVVDFHDVYTLPRVFLESLLQNRGQYRLRLRPPYREHLSQAFARFFMRVGLPMGVNKIW